MGKIVFEKIKKLFLPRGLSIQKVYGLGGVPFLLKISGKSNFYVYYDSKKSFDITPLKLYRMETEGVILDFVKSFVSPIDFVLETHACIWTNIDGLPTCYSENFLPDTEIPIDYIEGTVPNKISKIGQGSEFYICLKWSEVRILLKNPMEEYLKTAEAEFKINLVEHTKLYHKNILKSLLERFQLPTFDSIIHLSKVDDILEFLSN